MDELKMTGNCLKGSRGLLSFDKGFDETEWGKLTKEVFTQVCFSTETNALFSLTDMRIHTPDLWRPFHLEAIQTIH